MAKSSCMVVFMLTYLLVLFIFLCKNCDDLLCSVRGNLSQVSLCVHDNKVLFSVLLTSCMVMWKILSHFWWNYARFLC